MIDMYEVINNMIEYYRSPRVKQKIKSQKLNVRNLILANTDNKLKTTRLVSDVA